MTHDLINDLSNLTTISEKTLSKLCEKGIYCICDCVQESILDNNDLTYIDLGLGTLQLKREGNKILYRFSPSMLLEQKVKETVETGNNPLKATVEQALIDRMTNTYKDLL